jgi:catechol 2,3-dioxygenase-like lactoylglutathione lyase family enzyme
MKTLFLTLLSLACGAQVHAAPPEPRAVEAHVDHLVLGVRDLDEGIRLFEERTGVRPKVGGEHPGRGTRNALVSLGASLYIEILAPQVNAPDSGRVAWLRQQSDLTPFGWAVFVRDVEAARQRLGEAGFELSEVVPGSRARPDGTLLEWKAFDIAKPEIPMIPFFIRWGDGTTHPSQDSPSGCLLERLRVVTTDVDGLRRVLAALAVDVTTEKGLKPDLNIVLRCPKGTVELRGDQGSRK